MDQPRLMVIMADSGGPDASDTQFYSHVTARVKALRAGGQGVKHDINFSCC
jgi:hypothetical protein